jgi:hypothetical protein
MNGKSSGKQISQFMYIFSVTAGFRGVGVIGIQRLYKQM